MCELYTAWPIDRITLYVEGGVEPLQVVGFDGIVGESGFGDVVDEGDKCDELEGDESNEGDELNELVCYDWMNDGLEGVDFTNDIFWGNEDDNAVPGEVVGNEGNNSTHEVRGNGGNNASDAQPSMQPEVGSNKGNNAQPGVGSNEGNNAQPEVRNNAQLSMGIDRIRVRQYAPSTTRPNQPDMQAADWIEIGIEDHEINTGAISNDEDPKDRHPEFNEQTDMRKPELVIGTKFSNSKVFREALREYVVNKPVDIKFKLNEKTKISVHCKNDCGWRLYASVVPGKLTFQIRTFHSVCTCGKSFQHS